MGETLIDRQRILDYLTREAPWSDSHGGRDDFLGMGMMYYALVYVLRAQTAVCLGSGGGFVPRLMRQAQRDLGIGTGRTILVDANRVESGWGAPHWLGPDSFFRQHFSDVEIVIETTLEAAERYFAPQELRIDYLHIDADHSFEACLADFAAYRPFLREGSVVTLHDSNFPQSGVKHVVEHIRTLGDCEVIDFPKIGAGTAIVRISGDPDSTRTMRPKPYGMTEGAVSAVRRSGARPLAPAGRGWKYLESDAFSSRAILAAHYVAECSTVVEIGSAQTPIHRFLTGAHERVIVVDPLVREAELSSLRGARCRVSQIRARFQDVTWRIERSGEHGLVMLGMELQDLAPDDYEVLFELVESSRVTVIEFPPSWDPSRQQYESIRAHTRTRESFRARLDLTGNDVGDLNNSWPPRFDREIHVLEPCHDQ